jgi:CO/xanthine dehydrogenase Mo-binding subunit
MVNILERLIDKAAAQTGIDRAELRRRNLAPTLPATNAFGNTIDSGAFSETFALALQDADVAGFAERRRGSEASGKRRGLGFAYHIKATGGSPYENVDIRFEENGTVALITGTQTIGQGHETTFPQILADRLGVPNERIRLCQGDTNLIAAGGGHGSSRATYMGGTAMWRASDIIIEKGRRIAAEALEAAEADLTFADGRFVVAGTDRAIELFEVAWLGREAGAPLDTFYGWTREHMTYPNGTHVAEVEVDPETGETVLLRYSGVDDYGVVVNPLIAAGQAHGAMAMGIGQALFGGGGLRSAIGAAAGRLVHGLRVAARRRSAPLRARLQRNTLHDKPARRERLRRGRRRCRVSGSPQRDTRCARVIRGKRNRRRRDPVPSLAGDPAAGGRLSRVPVLDSLLLSMPAVHFTQRFSRGFRLATCWS